MAEHLEHVTVDAWGEDCIEGECEHRDESGEPEDLSVCPSFPMDVCVDCMVESGRTSDPEWWEGSLSPWPHVLEPVPFIPEPAIFKERAVGHG